MFDPGLDWHTIKTEHFRLHFPERLDEFARRAALILEEIYPDVTEKWNWKPRGYTEVVVVDNTDDSNGLSMVLPYNWMLLYVAPPPPDSSLAHYDDWFRMLIIHEFTHIVQIDAVGGFMSFLRLPMGKTVAPSGINPTWIREGIAQYDETIMTEGGRGRGAYSEMIVRTAILDDAFLKIDQADGLGWKWPGYKSAYVYGVKFLHHLIDTYGEEKFLEFDRRVRSSPLLTMINHQARNVWGKTFYELWNEWRQELENRYGLLEAKLSAEGLTELEPVVTGRRDEQYGAPAVSPTGDWLAYSVTSPHTRPRIRIKDLATGEVKTIKKGQGSPQIAWSRDETKLVWASAGGYKRYNRYYDLWIYDFDSDKPKARRLTKGERARDPEFDPSGESVIFVSSEAGTDQMKRVDIESGEVTVLTPDVPDGTQLANPRFSPSGRHVALSVWKPGYGWRIYRANSDGTNPVRLTRTPGLVVESRPSWTPDGRFVIFASDESGIGNLYRVSKDGGRHQRITNVLTGIYQPSVAPDNRIFAQFYTSTGFEIVSLVPGRSWAASEDGEGDRVSKRAGLGVGSGASVADSGKEHSIFHKEAPDPILSESENLAATSPDPVRSRLHMNPGAAMRPKIAETNDAMFAVPAGGPGEADENGLRSGKYVAFGRSLFRPRFIMPTAAI
ncbi:MAG TPA: hypothetical protein PLZ86_04125, partial [bacterium]|nr:hypothetical protein [bacterium]